MFTGIIEEIGLVKNVQLQSGMTTLAIGCQRVVEQTKVGDSIAVDGVCLTVTGIAKDTVTFDAIHETLQRTTLKDLHVGGKVNLERALKSGDRLGGHFVSGHVDCVGTIRDKRHVSKDVVFTIAVPVEFILYIVPKGSITIDGVSLTVVEVRGSVFSVHLIPHTLATTTLGSKGHSAKVNIEVDIIGKYVLSRK